MNTQFTIRPARPDETGLVLEFIKKLAVYEKCADEVVADEPTLYHSLFVEHSAEVVFAEEDSAVVGFALFFHNFSTFVGRKGLYLEDLLAGIVTLAQAHHAPADKVESRHYAGNAVGRVRAVQVGFMNHGIPGAVSQKNAYLRNMPLMTFSS